MRWSILTAAAILGLTRLAQALPATASPEARDNSYNSLVTGRPPLAVMPFTESPQHSANTILSRAVQNTIFTQTSRVEGRQFETEQVRLQADKKYTFNIGSTIGIERLVVYVWDSTSGTWFPSAFYPWVGYGRSFEWTADRTTYYLWVALFAQPNTSVQVSVLEEDPPEPLAGPAPPDAAAAPEGSPALPGAPPVDQGLAGSQPQAQWLDNEGTQAQRMAEFGRARGRWLERWGGVDLSSAPAVRRRSRPLSPPRL